jgi:hypothetical protein
MIGVVCDSANLLGASRPFVAVFSKAPEPWLVIRGKGERGPARRAAGSERSAEAGL